MNLKIPNHIAIIMDGNGRWAERRGKQRAFGHVRGSSRVKAIVEESIKMKVKALTLYAFSTENWYRPESEKKVLWKLFKKYLVRYTSDLNEQNVRLQVIGEVDRLDPDVQKILTDSINKLKNNTGLLLSFALSYGARREISRAARLFSEDCLKGIMKPEDMSEEVLQNYLWTSHLGDLTEVDLFIRTSGEHRISNFLLWQSAYAEFVFLDVCWPDFLPIHLQQSIREYSLRDRRFGKIFKHIEKLDEISIV